MTKAMQMLHDTEAIRKELTHSRIFLLTDGEVENRDEVIAAAVVQPSANVSLHTFGIGGQCDKDMVQKIARNGNGSHFLIENMQVLEKSVILALKRASGLSAKCRIQVGTEIKEVQIYQNLPHTEYYFIKKEEFAGAITVTCTSDFERKALPKMEFYPEDFI